MTRHIILMLALLATAAMAQTPSAPEIVVARLELGALPPDFTGGRTGHGAPGQWSVIADASAAGGRAIAQTSADRTDYRFPLAIYQPIEVANVEVAIRFKAVSGRGDQAGGIALRLTSPDNYYVVRANALEDNVRFYRVVKGERQQLASATVKVAPGQWHALTIRAEGTRFSIGFDSKPLFQATDATFVGAGKVALWTKADSVTHFDRIAIQPL
jgi:hypothetical protein